MSSLGIQAEIILLKQLQRCYKDITLQQTVFNKCIRAMKADLENVLNLTEQLSCCRRVDIRNTPLAQFPDLSARLEYKITAEIEDGLSSINECIKKLRECSNKVKMSSRMCMNVYNQHSDAFSVDQLIAEHPTRPSISTLLEWSQDAHRHIHAEYCKQENLLENVSYSDVATLENLVQSWNATPDLQYLNNDILPYVSFFIKEDL